MGKVALLFLGGTVTPDDLKIAGSYDFVCCADSGLDQAKKLNIFPNLVVGDLDSISEDGLDWIKNRNIEVIKHPTEKDFTDGQLAVTHLINHHEKFDEIHILGLMGGRSDHIYGNFLLLFDREHENQKIKAYSDRFEIQIIPKGEHWFDTKPGAIVSIFAFRVPARVSLTGLKYSYEGLLNPLTPRGISNISWGSFHIKTNSELLVFIQTQV